MTEQRRQRGLLHLPRPQPHAEERLARSMAWARNGEAHSTLHPLREELRGLLGAAERLWRDLQMGSPAPVPGQRGHAQRVAAFSLRMAHALRLSEELCRRICRVAYLHDVGKIGVSRAILGKAGELTAEERAALHVHPLLSRELLRAFLPTQDVAGIALSHHERYDGQGYPQGLQGARIPLEAQVLAIADSLDAMISRGPQARLRSFALAWEEVVRQAGRQFDPCIVESLVRVDGRW